MKKLIIAVGASTLLFPGAALAGGYSNSIDASAYDETGSSYSQTAVQVDSYLHKNNTMYTAGYNWGASKNIVADDLSIGGRHYGYAEGSSLHQDANASSLVEDSIVDQDVVVAEEFDDLEVETTAGEIRIPWVGTFGRETVVTNGEVTTETVGTTNETGVLAEGDTSTSEDTLAGEIGAGGELYIDGQGSFTYGEYGNAFAGRLHENGEVNTFVDSFTAEATLFDGGSAESGHDMSFN
jgi:hypothetical protein